MMFEFHPEARVELTEAALHYDRQVPGLGERLVRRVVDLLTKQPHIGIPADPNLHKFVLTRFPFILYYSFTGDVLRIGPLRTKVGVRAIGRIELPRREEAECVTRSDENLSQNHALGGTASNLFPSFVRRGKGRSKL
jgi:hypothetical protein